MLAASPLRAMRSAPKTTASTRPRANSWPAATSAISVCGMPSSASSQAVSRAPCRSGRVSSTQTWIPRIARVRGADDAERRAVAAGRERPGVAVREDPGAGGQQRCAVPAHRHAAGDLVVVDAEREGREGVPERVGGLRARDRLVAAIERPAEVDRGRPRGGELGAGGQELAAQRLERRRRGSSRRLRHAHRRGDPDRRRAADRELADGRAELGNGDAAAVGSLARQARLVEHDDGAGLEPDDVGGREHGRSLARRAVAACRDARRRHGPTLRLPVPA